MPVMRRAFRPAGNLDAALVFDSTRDLAAQ
jgi:hypothetical protein